MVIGECKVTKLKYNKLRQEKQFALLTMATIAEGTITPKCVLIHFGFIRF
jgi:hypothetical protein